ncbi:hypothetical protein BDFG_07049 [Blastomyces dermatitidis ATCC 26199]|nr:hypothetical protein BDFG_07049 [Blastomyces dermatitidis ATCC 26199]
MTPIYAKAGSALSDWIDNRQGEDDVIRSSTPAARIKPTSTSSTDCLSLKLARLLVDTHYRLVNISNSTMSLSTVSIAKGMDVGRIGALRLLPHLMRHTTLPCFRGTPRSISSTRARHSLCKNSQQILCFSRKNASIASMALQQPCRHTMSYSSMPQAQRPKADDYIQELQDLYEIAKDELEIAAESTAASTIYAVSDRISLREAFDDLDRAYAAYTGTTPHPSHLERPPPSSSANAVNGAGGANEAGEAEGEEGQTRGSSSSSSSSMRFNPVEVPDEVREEIKRRIGQRIRELRNAVEQLEESVRE